LIAERGRLMQALPAGGAMVAIQASEVQVTNAMQSCAEMVSIAAINGPESVVISGQQQAIETICAELEKQGIRTKKLTVSHAFHSPLMEPMIAAFRRVAETITYAEPAIDMISLVTGKVVAPADRITSAEYWCHHVLAPVRFDDGMQSLYQQEVDTFVEVGPKPVLLGMARQGFSDEPSSSAAARLWLPTLRPFPSASDEDNAVADDWRQILKSLGDLYIRGADVDWTAFHANRDAQKVVLPTYPFQRARYWIEENNNHFGENGATAHEGIIPHQRSNVMNLLAQGDAGQLAARLGRLGQFTPEQQTFLSSALELLVHEHQQEQLTAQLAVADWFYESVWRPQSRVEAGATAVVTKETDLGCWLIFADQGGMGEALADHLAQQGQRPLLVYATHGESCQRNDCWYLNPTQLADFQQVVESLTHEQSLHQIVYLWGLDTPEAEAQDDGAALLQNSIQRCGGVLHLMQAVTAQTYLLQGRVWLVTRGAVSIQDEPVAVAQTPLWGLGKVVALEHPQVWGGMFDLSPRYESLRSKNGAVPELVDCTYPKDAQLIYTEIVDASCAQQKEDAVAFRGEERYVARLVSSTRFGATSPNPL
ncbi:MAG: acyltransferase domain-containing protein, partial [Caldilineaceae bacterium]|nr:acyltransferase domain-containing protein [Caldilineaceae bacterium]